MYFYIVVQEPSTSELYAFRMRALPFGAIRSVHNFLRFMYNTWFILISEFLILTTGYFDDFLILATSAESGAVTSCVQLVLKMLGWAFAETGPKAPDFSETFQALGVLLDVRSIHRGLALVINTESRRRDLVQILTSILEDGHLSQIDVLRLRGRLQFAAGNIFGRIVKAALSVVTARTY